MLDIFAVLDFQFRHMAHRLRTKRIGGCLHAALRNNERKYLRVNRKAIVECLDVTLTFKNHFTGAFTGGGLATPP